MKATLKADHTQELFDKMSNIVTEAILRFTDEGLEVTTADPAMVSMIDLEVPEDSFSEYQIDLEDEKLEHLQEEDEQGILIGVDLENLASIVKLFDNKITFTTEESNLILTEENDRFELPILNLSTDDIPNTDSLEHDIKARLENNQLKTLVKKMAVASESTTVELEEDGTLEVEGGGDQISVETSFNLDEAENLSENIESVESMFALDYLKKAERVFRGLDTCDNLEIKMGQDFPMEMTHSDQRENLKFVLAPRIEEK